jgi:hypothetical protein
MKIIDNALLFDIFHERDTRIQKAAERAIKNSEEDVCPSLHNQLGAISHRVDRAIENIEIGSPRPKVGVPMHEGEI